MVNQKIREELPEDAVVFDNIAYDNSIVGYDEATGRVIYDYDMMINELIIEEAMSYEEAVDWISYNTIRALNYSGDEKKPIIMYPVNI